MISSLRQRNYRLFFFGQLVSVAGTWMQTVAQSFLVLDLTHSGTQLGLTTAARFLPMFLFGPLGGVFADRMDKQRVLYVTQALSGLLAGAFAVTVATHSIRLWIVYLLALALGFVNVFDNPARQSFISEMVPAADLPNAVTLNSVSMNMARVFGAALGGVIAAAIGLALCFTVNALSFGAVLISLAAMHRSELFPAKRIPRKKRQVRQGLRYVRSTPELLIPLLLTAVIGTLAWEFNVTLPLMASQVFHGGAAAYGVMASVMGIGAVVGGLISAARPRPRARALCLAAIGWGIAILAAAAAPNLPRRADEFAPRDALHSDNSANKGGVMSDQAFITCLWFDTEAEEAASFYTGIFKDSKLGRVHRHTEAGPGPAGSVLLVEFELNGQKFSALNGGPQFKFNEAVSIVVPCADQAEVDYYWSHLAEGGEEVACGWLKDKYGLCWQIVPTVFFEMIADPDRQKAARVTQAMLGMTKLDVAALEQAYAG